MTSLASAVNAARKRLSDLQQEIDMLEQVLGDRRVCEGCRGTGIVRRWLAADETEAVKCDDCQGSGVEERKARK